MTLRSNCFARNCLALAVPALLASTPAFAQQARLNLTNRAAGPIDIIQVSPSSSNDWGEDLLGRLQLMPGSTVAVNFPANADCRQDVRVVFNDRTEETRMQVDACTSRDIAFDASTARPVAPAR